MSKKSFDRLEELMQYCQSIKPKQLAYVKNKARYNVVVDAMNKICEFAKESSHDVKFSIEPNGTSVILEILTPYIAFEDMKRFCHVLADASSFEIDVKKGDKVSIVVGFRNVWVHTPADIEFVEHA